MALVAARTSEGECPGVGRGFWVISLLLDRLDSLLIQLKNTSRLVFSPSMRFLLFIQVCRVLIELMPSIQNRRLCHLTEEFTLLALSCMQSISPGSGSEGVTPASYCLLADVLVHCLASQWRYSVNNGADDNKRVEYSSTVPALPSAIGSVTSVGDDVNETHLEEKESNEKSTVDNKSDSKGDRSWSSVYHSDMDFNGLALCLRLLFSYLRFRVLQNPPSAIGVGTSLLTSDDINIPELVTAIDICLQNQLKRGGRQAGVVLLQASGVTISSSLHTEAKKTSQRDQYDDVFMLSIIGNPHIEPCIRILLTKVLDIVFTSQSLLASSVRDPPSVDTGEEKEEQNELQEGEVLTRHLLGDTLFDMFQLRSKAPHSHEDGEEVAAGYVVCSDTACSSSHDDHSTNATTAMILPVVSLSDSFSKRSLVLAGYPYDLSVDNNNSTSTAIKSQNSKVSSDPFENCADTLGLILLHLLVLQKIDTVCTSGNSAWAHKRAAVGLFLTQSQIISPVLQVLIQAQHVLPVPAVTADFVGMFGALDPCSFSSSGDEDCDSALGSLLAYTLYRSTSFLPVATRTYWNDHCSRSQRVQLEKFIETRINRNIVKREIAIVRLAEQQGRVKATSNSLTSSPPSFAEEDEDGGITIRCSAVAQEFITTFTADEVSIEMTIRLPILYPLRNVSIAAALQLVLSGVYSVVYCIR